jgi:hypothetical protein
MHSDSKKRRSFVALLFAAGDVRRYAPIKNKRDYEKYDMDNIIIELMKRYGIWAILALSVTGATVWFVAHSQAKPGDKVSILWGMVEYTKSKSQTERNSIDSEKDQPPITKPLTTAYQPSTVRKVEIGDITLALQACRHSGSNIICDLLITSTKDTEPDGIMIHIKGDFKSKIIDYSGKEYYANLVKLGERSHAWSVEGKLYANMPKRASLYFENVSILKEQILVLEIEGYLLPGTRISASFRDIPLFK